MNVQCHACIGGTNVGEDIRKLDYGQHVVSGTPGRVFGELGHLSVIFQMCVYITILDMIRRGNLRTRSIKLLVLDEADEMLAKGTASYIFNVLIFMDVF